MPPVTELEKAETPIEEIMLVESVATLDALADTAESVEDTLAMARDHFELVASVDPDGDGSGSDYAPLLYPLTEALAALDRAIGVEFRRSNYLANQSLQRAENKYDQLRQKMDDDDPAFD